MIKNLPFLPCLMLLFFGLTTTSLLNGQAVLIGTPTGGDANDPSLAVNNPTGVACAGGGTETWLDFDGVAGNNASQEGGMAIGARHNEDVLYTFPSQPAGDYLLFYEHANPGLLECDGTMLNGNGRWRFNIGNGNVNGPIIASGISTTMEWFKASVSMTATAAFTTLNMEARRQGALGNPYMQIDNVVLIAVPAGAGPCYMSDLGSPALNACYGTDVCFPQSNSCAEITPGDPHMNPAGCPVTAGDPDALVIIPIPDFDPDMDCAAAEAMTFDMVVPDLKVHYTYWGNCSPRSPEMPTVLDAQNQGFITQFFCDLDTDGLPAFPSGLSGESGIVDFIPANTEDAGCNGFVDEATSDCICGAGSNGTDPEDAGVELLQLDFWVAIPTYQTQVGFNFDNHTGNPVEGASFFAGPNTASMCEVNYYNFGGAGGDHNDEPQQPSGTYTLDHGSLLQDDCNASWLRVRVYMSDVKDRWGIIPQMDCGNGYGPISALPVAPAMSAGDNSQPAALTTMSVEGYSLLDTESGITFFYDALGNPKKYACNPVALVGDTGVCAGPCPVPNPIDVTDDEVCDGMLGTTISDWMDDVEADADNMAAIADAITGDAIIYSLDTAPTEAAPPTAGEADASHTGTGCANETETTYAYLLCLGADAAVGGGDDTYLLLGTHTLTVFPPAQDPMDVIDACINTPTAICPNDAFDAVATNATGGADVANWNGTTYTAQPGDAAGTIDLAVTTTNGCTGTFPIATPACPAMCPAVNPIDEMDEVCDGMLGTTISDWMMSVEADAANTAAIMDANTAAALIYSMDATPTETAPPTAGTADASHAGTGCANETETTYAYLLCLGADAAVGGGDDTYLLLGTHTLTVYPPAQDPMDVIDACTNTPTAICPNDAFDAVATNATGGADVANWNGTTYTAQPGDAAGTIDLAVTTTNGCTGTFPIATPACPAMCPAVNPIDEMDAVCDGILGTTISAWMMSVEADAANTAAIMDANTAAALIYSMDATPTETAPPTAGTADASHAGTGCANETETTYAYLLCLGADAAVGGGDDTYLLLGTHTLTVYPPAQDPMDVIDACTNTPTAICPNDAFDAVATNATGGADVANWNGTTYTAQPGDLAGTIDLTVTTTNGCTGTFPIATPACPAMCPAVNPIDEMDAVCDGMLGTTISDWMMSVEDDAANTAAIMDANTAASIIYSMDATPTETAPPTAGTADASHAGTGCANETETTYAYLLCLGADAAVGGGDDTYLLLGTHTLTVYPPAQDPMDVIDACTNTPTAICAGDSFGAASNPTGGASIANWNASTGVYTAQTGDAAGTIDIAITTTNNCTESFEITTPDCGGMCPVVNPIFGTAAVCDGMLGTTISDWETSVEMNPANAAAIADANTAAAIIYSVDVAPTEATPPSAVTADASHSGTGCANETESTYAYLLCMGIDGAVGGGDDIYMLLGIHTLTVYPPAQDPTDNITGCTNTPTLICDDTFGAASNPSGGASTANWDSVTGVYTAQSGDAAGTIDIEITTSNGCTGIFEIATPACGSCDDAGLTGADICASITALGAASPFHGIDCDDDGENNEDECDNGTDPLDPCDNSYADGDAVCAAIVAGATGFAGLDCDGGGVDDTVECDEGTDPTDPCDDTGLTGQDICDSITADGATSPFHGIDCDGDGENNEDECVNNTDPLDPCDNSYADGDAVCAAIVAGATGFAGLDCDGGGVDDTVECDEGTDPTDPCDDTGLTGADICASITALGTASPFHGIDCDGDGETNEDECDNGTDPLDPCDNSYADGDAVCAAIDAGATGFANVDCDGGGVSDEDECDDGTDPTDPCDDTGLTGTIICASIDAIGTASPFHGIDCDGDGETNEDECDNGTDPLDPCDNNYDTGDEICAAIDAGAIGFANVDCDGGGVSDEDECDEGTDPTDPCDDTGLTRTIICASIDALGTASPFHGIDCDGDGETNQDECDNGTDPLDPCDNNYDTGDEICAAIDAGATGFANVDCDGGGVNDEDECDEGTDPTDPCDDTGLTGTIICASLDALGTASPFHGIDCDGDGETNEVECDNGTDPLDPCDNNYDTGDEICAAILAGATGFADVDCDGGGVNDEQECANGTDPTDPCDDNPPAAPATECWETATYNNTTCIWEITGTQPAEPTNIECWETATFNNTTCTWNVTGTQPTEPTTECYQTATFNNTTCVWVVSGTQAAEPATECWETATFNNTNCTWNVTGTQPAEPTIECFEVAIFNNTTCLWEVSGSATEEPNIQCWETATFNATICSWVITGTQPREPDTECWETATFNNAICAWEVTGTLPADPGCDDGDCTNGMETWDGCDCIEGTPPVIGCTNPLADNYNPAATCDDASCEFGAVDDCPDPGNCDDNICENGIEMWDFDLCECVSGIAPDNCDDLEIISFDFDDCHAMTTDMSHTDYSEFQPEYPNTLDCGTIVASILHRDEPDTNSHSCTPGLDNSSSMCVSSLESCDADFTSNKAVKFSITVSPLAGDTITISSLQFMQNAPVNFDWINGSSGLNNYPTLYGIQVLQNGTIIYSQEDLSTSTAWTQEVHNFTGVSSIEISQQTTLDILLLSYCPVGVQSNVTAWDLENLKVFGSCNESLVGSRMISGKITSLNNEQFDDVLMTIEGGDNLVSAMADSNGEYSFADNSIGETYVVSAFKDSDYLKGISTLDLLIIQRHILGISTFNDPLLYHAADINNDSNISAIDLIDLRKLILGIIDEFPENLSYRFFDESKVRNDSNPWLLPEEIMVINLETDEYALDFNPIKVGDVTSLIAKKKTFNNRSNDSDNHIELYSSKTDSRYSDIVTTNFYITEQLSINGFQLAIDLKESEFGKLIASNQMLNDIDYHVSDDNILRILWTGEIHFASGENLLFSIQTTASHHDHKLSSVISPEIYVDTDAIKMQLIKNNSSLANSSITNLRVYPNPFSDKTEVEFDLINDSKVDIHLYDTAGKLLYRENRPFVKGKNRIPLNEELFTSGIYFIKVSTDKESLTDRLVKLK